MPSWLIMMSTSTYIWHICRSNSAVKLLSKTAYEIYYNSERPRTKSAFKRFSDFLKGGDFLDLDLLFEIGGKFSRLILNKFSQTQKEFYATLSNVDSGKLEVKNQPKRPEACYYGNLCITFGS